MCGKRWDFPTFLDVLSVILGPGFSRLLKQMRSNVYAHVFVSVCIASEDWQFNPSVSGHPQVFLQGLHRAQASPGLSSHERCGARQGEED